MPSLLDPFGLSDQDPLDPYIGAYGSLAGPGRGSPGGLPIQARDASPFYLTRERIQRELQDNPFLQRGFDQNTTAEVGTDPYARRNYQAATIDRAVQTGQPLANIVNNPNYYPATTTRATATTGQDVDPSLYEGANPVNYATGNASYDPKTGHYVGFAGGPQTASHKGEYYGVEGQAGLPYARAMGYTGPSRTAIGPAGPQGTGDATALAGSDAYASGPSPARKSMADTSLMDMFQPRSNVDNSPISFSDAIAQNRGSLIGLGMGLLQPRSLAVGAPTGSGFTNALAGYAQGSQADAANAYRQAQLAHTQRQEAFQRSQAAQAQSNWQKDFGLKGAPTWGKIGEDQFGQAQYGFVDPRKGTVTPYAPAPAEGDQPAPGRQATVDAILEGRMAPPTSFAASKPYWQGILAQAAQKEPGFDLTQWGTRFATRKDFGSGIAARNATALDTVTGHLETLMDKSKALDNYSFPMVNQVKNYLGVQAGQPQVTEFNLARNAVSDELAKVFRSTGMSDAEIRAWKTNLDAAGSPDQLKGAVKTAIELVDSRRDALKEQYQRGMGKEPPELLSAKGQKSLERVRNWASGGKDEESAKPTARPPGSGLEGMSKKEIQQELIRRGVLNANSL